MFWFFICICAQLSRLRVRMFSFPNFIRPRLWSIWALTRTSLPNFVHQFLSNFHQFPQNLQTDQPHQEAFGLPPTPFQCGDDSLRSCLHLPYPHLHPCWTSWSSYCCCFEELKLFCHNLLSLKIPMNVSHNIKLENTFSINTSRLGPPQPEWKLK